MKRDETQGAIRADKGRSTSKVEKTAGTRTKKNLENNQESKGAKRAAYDNFTFLLIGVWLPFLKTFFFLLHGH